MSPTVGDVTTGGGKARFRRKAKVLKSSAAAVKAWRSRKGAGNQTQASRDTAAVMLRSARNAVRNPFKSRGTVQQARAVLRVHRRTVVRPTVAMARLRAMGVAKSAGSWSESDHVEELIESTGLAGPAMFARSAALHYAARARVREVLEHRANQLREKLGMLNG